MAEERDLATTAQLNAVLDLLAAIKSGDLGKIIGGGLNTNPRAGCDYDCGCNQSMCGCRGTVKGREFDTISFPEFLAMREARLVELRQEMEALNIPDRIK